MTDLCCDLHLDGRGACCDPDDCAPCCAKCPTCPTTRNFRDLPRRSRARGERGAVSGLLSSVIVVIALIVAIRLISHGRLDPLDWLAGAVAWSEQALHDLLGWFGGPGA